MKLQHSSNVTLAYLATSLLQSRWQVHRRADPSQLQQEARGPAAGGAAVSHLGPGAGCGLSYHPGRQQCGGSRPRRVQAGEHRLRALLVRVLLLHPLPHHAAALLRHVSRPAALGGGAQGQTEEQHPGLPQAAGGRRRLAAAAGLAATAVAARHREGADGHFGRAVRLPGALRRGREEQGRRPARSELRRY